MKAIQGMTFEEIVAELERIATLLANRFALCAPVPARGMKVPSGAKALGEHDVCAMVVDDLAITFGIVADTTVNAGA